MSENGTLKKKQPRIAGEELFVISETPADAKGRSHKLRVVRWVVAGVGQPPKLEKRGFYRGRKSGHIMTGDLEALTGADVRALGTHLARVLELTEAAKAG